MPYIPKAGDLLLLSGFSWTTKPNKIGQSLARLRKAKHSHVAIAYNDVMIADATPNRGVSLRSWREASVDYDLAKSTVFRSRSAIALDRFQRNVEYYLRQPYRLFSILNKTNLATNDAGIVCSQFASAVFVDVGIRISPRTSKKCLPLDIFDYLRHSRKWQTIHPIESPTSVLDLPEKFELLQAKLDARALDWELEFSKSQHSLNQLFAQISSTDFENLEANDLFALNSLLNTFEPQSECRQSHAAIHLDAWENCFLRNMIRTDIRFLHESSEAVSPWARQLLDASTQATKIAREVLPTAHDNLYDLLNRTTSLLKIAVSYSLTEGQMSKLLGQCSEAIRLAEAQISNIDELILGYGGATAARTETLLAEVGTIIPLKDRALALDCLEGHFLLGHRADLWDKGRTPIEQWVDKLKSLTARLAR